MAVTEILGTDSLSSSRVTLNQNFITLEDEINDIKTYLDPTALTLTGLSVTATALSVSGTSALSVTTASTITTTGDCEFGAAVIKTGITGTSSSGVAALTSPFASSSYFVDATLNVTLDASTSAGQEISIIAAVAGDIDGTNIAGSGNVTLAQYGTLTLRSDGTSWYIIGKS